MTPEECRQKSEDCRVLASKALSPDKKAAWLKLAEEWFRLSEAQDGREQKASCGRRSLGPSCERRTIPKP